MNFVNIDAGLWFLGFALKMCSLLNVNWAIQRALYKNRFVTKIS